MTRTGRRAGDSGTREAILGAARAAFSERGLDGATVRGIAAAAGVDPSLVLHYHGSKNRLFLAAMELPFKPGEVIPCILAGDPDHVGERLVRFFVTVWDAAGNQNVLIELSSACTDQGAADMIRERVVREVLGPVAEALGRPDAELRAALVGSQMLGLALQRYIVRLEPLASADADSLAAAVGPSLQRYLTGDLSHPQEDA